MSWFYIWNSKGGGIKGIQQSSCERATDVSVLLMVGGLDLQLRHLKLCERRHVCVAFSCHLHSWCLQRSTQTSGGEHWWFLQASEEQPGETPCTATTCSLSELCSWSRGTACPFSLRSLIQPGQKRETCFKQATPHTGLCLTLESMMCKFPFYIQGMCYGLYRCPAWPFLPALLANTWTPLSPMHTSPHSFICGWKCKITFSLPGLTDTNAGFFLVCLQIICISYETIPKSCFNWQLERSIDGDHSLGQFVFREEGTWWEMNFHDIDHTVGENNCSL